MSFRTNTFGDWSGLFLDGSTTPGDLSIHCAGGIDISVSKYTLGDQTLLRALSGNPHFWIPAFEEGASWRVFP